MRYILEWIYFLKTLHPGIELDITFTCFIGRIGILLMFLKMSQLNKE